MAGGNIIVTSTINKVSWSVDNNSYAKAMKKIRSMGEAWNKAMNGVGTRNSGINRMMQATARQATLQKRVNQITRAEDTRTANNAIAQAKRIAKAREVIERRERARRMQAVKGITAKDPELAKMRKFYQDQAKTSKRLGGNTNNPITSAEWAAYAARKRAQAGQGVTSTDQIRPSIKAAAERIAREQAKRGGGNGGMAGTPRSGSGGTWTDNIGRRAHREITNMPPMQTPAEIREQARAAARLRAQQAAQARAAARREETISANSIRLRSRYGNNFAGRMGGFDDLNRRFRAGSLGTSSYRAELSALERQLRSSNAAALSFSDGMGQLRRSMIAVTAAYGAFNTAASIVKTGQFYQGLEATMALVSDSSAEASKRIEFIKKESYRLGLDVQKATQGYVQMSVSANGQISKSQTNELFTGYSEYATALQVDPVKYQRGITAIQQMLGKGQIMSEELKQQLAEAIPGSLQVFINAARKAYKDESLDFGKLQDLMKKGKVLAKDILPLVGDEFAQAARKGGALTKALASNRVAMQRMQLTWDLFKNKIFESKFGEVLTESFNNIAKILDANGPLANNIGQFIAGFIEGFSEIAYTVHDVVLLLEKLAKKLGATAEDLETGYNWLGWAVGALVFFGVLSRIFGVLSRIAGLRGSLGFLGTLGGAAAGGAGAAAAAAGKGILGKVAGLMITYGAVTTANSKLDAMRKGAAEANMSVGDYALKSLQDKDKNASPFISPETLKGIVFGSGPTIGTGGTGGYGYGRDLSQYSPMGLVPNGSYQPPIKVDVSGEAKLTVESKVQVDDDKITGLITEAIGNNTMQTVNMILGTGSN